MKLSYNKVFDRYAMSFSDKLAELSYSLFRTLRLRLAIIFSLSEHEKYRFDDDPFSKKESANMPQGFDYIANKSVDGFVELDYIDLYDYLPKEDLSKFIKQFKKCVRRNKITPFGAFRSREDIDKIDSFSQYYDGQIFTHILSVRFCKNKNLQQYCSDISVSLRNLSATFLVVWNSISFDRNADYAPTYNACVCWDYKRSNYEGIRLAAYCGGNYTKNDYLPEIVHHDVSDIYGVYLTASTLGIVSERDIAICNKKISKVIRKAKTSSVLKVRVAVERKLYYGYRFISEFSGKTIDHDDAKAFRHQFYKKGSVSSRSLEDISKRTKETKTQIDNILKLLNDAAEYRSSESNIKLQWIMMVVTILSLIVALCSINNGAVINEIKNLIERIETLISQ